MTRTERLLELMQRLRRSRQPRQAQALAEQLDISVRTLYRDIDTLRHQGADIEGEAGVGYVLKRGGPTLPPLMFRESEIEALVLGSRWVADRADPRMRDAALAALGRISAVVPPDLREEMDTSALLVVPGAPFPVDAVDPGLLRKAIRTERRLRLCYRDEAGAASERLVWPFALAFFDRVRLLIAWCELRGDFRSFRTDRIVEAEVMEARYPARRQVLMKRWKETHERSQSARC